MAKKSRETYRRARLSALAGGGAFGSGVGLGADAASNLASDARSGSRRGAWGKRSSSTRRRIAAVTAAISSSVRLMVGMALARPLSAKAFDPALHGELIAVRHVHHSDRY